MLRFSCKWFQYFTGKSVIAIISHSNLLLPKNKRWRESNSNKSDGDCNRQVLSFGGQTKLMMCQTRRFDYNWVKVCIKDRFQGWQSLPYREVGGGGGELQHLQSFSRCHKSSLREATDRSVLGQLWQIFTAKVIR